MLDDRGDETDEVAIDLVLEVGVQVPETLWAREIPFVNEGDNLIREEALLTGLYMTLSVRFQTVSIL